MSFEAQILTACSLSMLCQRRRLSPQNIVKTFMVLNPKGCRVATNLTAMGKECLTVRWDPQAYPHYTQRQSVVID